MPTPTAITPSAGNPVTVTTGQLTAVSYPAGNGINDILLSATESSITPAFSVLDNTGAYRTNANGSSPEVVTLGFAQGQATTVVIDPELDLAFDPAVFTLDITAGTAKALSTTGGAVSEPVTLTEAPQSETDLDNENVFAYVVPNNADTMGLKLSFNVGVEGFFQ